MEEKIGMEKLIELLNKYGKVIGKSEYYEWEKSVGGPFCLFVRDLYDEHHIYSETADTYAISKKYGFIKWLVENDKIDRDNAMLRKSLWETDTSDIDKIIYTIKNSDYHYVMREAPYEAEESLLMLLSISDTPIEDLLLYLK